MTALTTAARPAADRHGPDLRALLIAAAGGHHLRLTGQDTTVRDMLAERLVRLMPGMDLATRIEADRIPGHTPGRAVPLVQLRRGATLTTVLGRVGPAGDRPGAASLAHGGVLYVTDSAQVPAAAARALIEVLESGEVAFESARRTATGTVLRIVRFPARFTLLLGAPACPCALTDCVCPPHRRTAPWGHILPTLQDRIDLKAGAPDRAHEDWSVPTASEVGQVVEARTRALWRMSGTPWTTNSHVPPADRRTWPALPDVAAEYLRELLAAGTLTVRGVDRSHRVAWTIADLDGLDRPGPAQVAEAVAYRLGVAHPERAAD